MPQVSWEELLARAQAALDEQGLEQQEKREAAAARIKARMERRGVKATWNLDGVRRALAAYFCDMVLSERPRGFRRVFAECGATPADLWDAEATNPDLMMVYKYVCDRIKRGARMEAEEMLRHAQDAQKRLVTEDGCELNQRAVELSLKVGARDVYGDCEKDGAAAADAKKGISYSFPNLTVNWIVAPAELAKRVEAKPQGEVVDV